ncbi:MAG: hypothetical protein ACHP79_03550, partial [Terriglobales bacterium]
MGNFAMLMGYVLLGLIAASALLAPKGQGFLGVVAPVAGGRDAAAPAGRGALLTAGLGAGDPAL